MKNKIIIVSISVVILGLAFWLATKFYKGQEATFISQQNFETFVRPHSARFGNDKAKVFLVEFMDPECETCRAMYSYVKEILQEHEGKVQLIVRYATFHPNSVYVIKILEAARKQNKYWETLSLLFQTQDTWASHHHPQPEKVWAQIETSGLNLEQLRADMDDPKFMNIIEQDRLDGSTLGVRLTPTFFVNGKPLEQFGLEQLRDAVRREVEEVK